jgi:predicted nucleotidyltransferase
MSQEQNAYGLSTTVVKQIQQVLSEFPQVYSAILYGSRAKGNYRPGSDIDLTLKINGHSEFHLLTSIMDALDNLDLPWSIDVSLLADINNDNLLKHIKRVGIEFYNITTYADTPESNADTDTDKNDITDIVRYLTELHKKTQHDINLPDNASWPQYKQLLVEQFINNHMPNLTANVNIKQQFYDYWVAQKRAAITTLSANENMDITAVQAMVENYYCSGKPPLRETVFTAFKHKLKLIERKAAFERVITRLTEVVNTF